jgi:hypothetical protein
MPESPRRREVQEEIAYGSRKGKPRSGNSGPFSPGAALPI